MAAEKLLRDLMLSDLMPSHLGNICSISKKTLPKSIDENAAGKKNNQTQNQTKTPGLCDLEASFNFITMGLRWFLEKYVNI